MISEPKILKDFVEYNPKECNGVEGLIKRESVKAEAIKWVKEDKRMIQSENSIITPIYLLKRWMRRLNITEADLQ